MEISIRSNIAEATRWASDVERRQVPFATALALTETAEHVKGRLQVHMQQAIDRPVRFTLNSLTATRATKQRLEAYVRFREFATKGTAAGKYLVPIEYGGARKLKRYERALQAAGVLQPGEFTVPAKGYKLNQYGNLPGSVITAILSQVKASRDATQNVTAASQARRARSRKPTYTAVRQGLPAGIWRRRGKKFEPVLIFVRQQPAYSRVLGFDLVGRRETAAYFPGAFARAMTKALATAR